MRERCSVGVVCALLALLAALLAGCQNSSDGTTTDAESRLSNEVAPTRPSGYGTVFLSVDECSSFGKTSFTEVPCTSERAAARVVARFDGTVGDGPLCPGTTDFVLHISEQSPSSDEDGDGAVPRGYACMRNLTPPHPGDPGGGGGPRTIVGDCVYSSGDGQVRETTCDGEGGKKPEYEVTKAVTSRAKCPVSTALYVQLRGEKPVGCARPV
jgi:predicted small secreted protein